MLIPVTPVSRRRQLSVHSDLQHCTSHDVILFPELCPVGSSRYGGPALTTLELVDYPETILPENALRSLTSLRSLTVRYRYIREGIECRLPSWLSPLQQLETLSIIGESGDIQSVTSSVRVYEFTSNNLFCFQMNPHSFITNEISETSE